MSGAYDCNYDFVDDPLSALVEAHAEIRRLEDEHAAEIARLRLTDAEREALSWARNAMLVGVAVLPDDQTHNSKQHAATLGALLERTE